MDNKTLAARALLRIKYLSFYKPEDIVKATEQVLKNNYFKLENAGVNKLAEVKDIKKAKETLLKWIDDRNKQQKSFCKSWGINLEDDKKSNFDSLLKVLKRDNIIDYNHSLKENTSAAREKIRQSIVKNEREKAAKSLNDDKRYARIEYDLDTYKSDLMNGNIPQEIMKRFNLKKPSPLKNNSWITIKKVSTPKKRTPLIKKTLKNVISRFTTSS